jgi:hypothetical protein
MNGKFTVRIEIGWWAAIPHNTNFPFTNEESEKIALLKAASLATVQPWAVLWEEVEGSPKRLLFHWKGLRGEWIDPAYHDIIKRLKEESNGRSNSH